MEKMEEEQKMFHPSNPILKSAALTAFKKMNGVNQIEVENFFSKMESASVPAPIGTKGSLVFAAIYGTVTVQPTSEPYKNCVFDHSFWGLGATGGSSVGFMYTAYDSWDDFFRNVTAFHVQSIAKVGGILQVNFFISNGTPVGQYNGAMAGLGVVKGGNSGKWSCR